jgi:hypothetical protein
MADAVSAGIKAALYEIVTTMDRSGNMRKDLKKTIFENVSNLRNLFTELKGITDEKTRQIIHDSEINKVKVELAACRREVAKAHVETSTAREGEPPGPDSRQVLPPHDRALYSRVLSGNTEKKHRLSRRSKTNQPPDITEKILSRKLTPQK